MRIELDHTIVPSPDKVAAAKLLAELLDVPWAESGLGPFSPVYVNDGLTLDFIETNEPFPDLSLLFSRERNGLRRDPRAHRGQRHRVPQRRARPDGRQDQHRLRRQDDLLERTGRTPVGAAHGQLRTSTGVIGRAVQGLVDGGASPVAADPPRMPCNRPGSFESNLRRRTCGGEQKQIVTTRTGSSLIEALPCGPDRSARRRCTRECSWHSIF